MFWRVGKFVQGGGVASPPQNTVSEGPWRGLQEGNKTLAKIGERIEDHTPRLVTPEGVGGFEGVCLLNSRNPNPRRV